MIKYNIFFIFINIIIYIINEKLISIIYILFLYNNILVYEYYKYFFYNFKEVWSGPSDRTPEEG